MPCFYFSQSWPYCFFGSWLEVLFYWFVCRMPGHNSFKLSAVKLLTQVWKLISAAFDLGVEKEDKGKGLREVIFSPEHTAYFYTFFTPTPVSESQRLSFNARKLCKSLTSLTVHVSFSETLCLMKLWFVKCSGAVVQYDP